MDSAYGTQIVNATRSPKEGGSAHLKTKAFYSSKFFWNAVNR
jgi:hypothetical protein